ncbi:MAG: hypothetical protein U0R50_04525 [Gaiellales bacterium]
MVEELKSDIAAAEAEGRSWSDITGDDVAGFAASWAAAKGVARGRLWLGLATGAALVGALPGVGLSLFAVYGPNRHEVFGVGEDTITVSWLLIPTWLVLALNVAGVLFAYGGAVAGVDWVLRWQRDPACGRTVRLMAKALPVGIVAALGAAVGLASTGTFSTSQWVVLANVVAPAVVFAGSVAVIRLAAVRGSRSRLAAVQRKG